MNNAYPFGFNVGVFDSGAGFTDIFAAATADTVVSATYDRVVHGNQSGLPFERQSFAETKTGSLSFGGINKTNETMHRTLQVEITNRGSSTQAYTISREFTKNPDNAAALNLSSTSVTVDAGATSDFSATMLIGNTAPTGFYEGHVRVHVGSELVAQLPFAAVVTQTRVVQVSTEAALRAAVAGTNGVAAEIELLNNITLIQTQNHLLIPSYAQITIRSSDNTIRTLTAGGNYDVISISSGAQLTLNNIRITRSSGTGGAGVYNMGDFTMLGGEISGNTNNGVANQGAFTMYDGEIFGNGGEGVINWEAFDMHGGSVRNNNGNGVVNNGSNGSSTTFTMYNGEIKNNSTGVRNTVEQNTNVVFIMHDGVISGNTNSGVNNWGTFDMYGGEISGNTSSSAGGGLYNSPNAVFNMSGGKISGNTTTGSGGAMFNFGTAVINGEISGNTATNAGGIGMNISDLRISGRLQIGANAVFSGNTTTGTNIINTPRNRSAADDALYAANIHGTRWTDPFLQGFNNIDIQYQSGTTAIIRTLSFELNGTAKNPITSPIVDNIRVIQGTPVMQAPSLPANPTREGYIFGGWYLNNETLITAATIMPSNDTTVLHARWTLQSPDNLYIKSAQNGLIELYNPTDKSISTRGMYILYDDDDDDSFEWQMPSVIVRSKQTILVKSTGDEAADAWKRMSFNFGLLFGKTLKLTDAGENVISVFELGAG
jgi:uncharacterized repeat protein (TIGR02543 family)